MNPIQELYHEHELIKLMLQVLTSMNKRLVEGLSVKGEDLQQALVFLQEFVDEYHHGKEDNLFFPVLEGKGIETELLEELSTEHMSTGEYVREIKDILENQEDEQRRAEMLVPRTEGFIAVMTLHLDKEEEIIFLRAEDALTEEEEESLEAQFKGYEANLSGAGGHEKYHDLLSSLSRVYL